MKLKLKKINLVVDCIGTPNEIRTHVAGVRGQCPRPLDDGSNDLIISNIKQKSNNNFHFAK